MVATNTLTRPAIDALPESSPLRRLPRDASPPKDVGPVADAWMRGQLQPLVDALKPGPDGKDALAKGRDRLAWLDHQLDRLPPVPTLAPLGPSRDAAKRALEALTLACAAEPDDVELAPGQRGEHRLDAGHGSRARHVRLDEAPGERRCEEGLTAVTVSIPSTRWSGVVALSRKPDAPARRAS